MINLLPPEEKRQLAAARTNTLLLRYSILMVVIVGLLVLEVIGMNFVVDIGTAQNQAVIKENETKTASYNDVKKQAETFTADLQTAKYILDKQAPYNTLIFTIAASLPSGATIDTLSIDPTTAGTPTTMVVRTISHDKAIEVKTALQNAKVGGVTPIFTSVSFLSIVAAEAGAKYPHNATYNVTYSRAALTR